MTSDVNERTNLVFEFVAAKSRSSAIYLSVDHIPVRGQVSSKVVLHSGVNRLASWCSISVQMRLIKQPYERPGASQQQQHRMKKNIKVIEFFRLVQ